MKTKLRLKTLILVLLAGTLCLTGNIGLGKGEAAPKWPSKLIFGYLPNEEAADANMKKGRDMLMKEMTAFLKIPVDVVICDDYNAVIETMRNKKLHIAQFGPFSYIIAHGRSKAQAICVAAKDVEHATYNSYLITHSGSGIKTIKDIRGKRMSFVDPASTSGNLVPRAMIVANFKVKPQEIDSNFFVSVQFAGNHTNSLLAAVNKSVDVAAVSSTTYRQCLEKGLARKEDIRIIIKSDPIPSSPIAIYGGLPASLKTKLKEFFLTYNNPEYFNLRKTPGYRFIEMKDQQYDSIRAIAKSMKLSPEELLK
jgi:phosphonate transport system substrate-binding protein